MFKFSVLLPIILYLCASAFAEAEDIIYSRPDFYKTETHTITFNYRPVLFVHPKANASTMNTVFPVVIIAHGGYSGAQDFYWTAQYLAKRGFVVVLPHFQPIARTREIRLKSTIDLNIVPSIFCVEFSYKSVNKTYPQFLSALIDYIASDDRSFIDDLLQITMDKNRIGLCGHSLGGIAALIVGGAKTQYGGFANPAIKALMVMEASGPSEGAKITDYTTISKPLLVLNCVRSTSKAKTKYELELPYYKCTSKEKYYGLLNGFIHFQFMGSSVLYVKNKTPNKFFETTSAYHLLFWDAMLNENQDAKNILNDTPFMQSFRLTHSWQP